MKNLFLFLSIVLLNSCATQVKLPDMDRFDGAIGKFEQQDSIDFPEPGSVLFIGSSSIVQWKTLADDMEGIDIVKRGFGGSIALEALHYIDRIVIPYAPSKIVFYEGDNDINMGISAKDFMATTEAFVTKVHQALPETEVYLLSVKPCPSRLHLWKEYAKANVLLGEFADKTDKVYFVDIATPMFNAPGVLKEDIFKEDNVHMNEKGYMIWTPIIRKALLHETP